ncbi:RagB/SusD family nutrient uptake outer membrane protein [Parapedobacter tibetensis]|uniref:RagB/SusD family nutrient uptake outer membrane protein n=1 Tax=Parapedobacter tibetensis TaxID=2972951 RepID=UPI00214D7473|nr:RagB/SusD family nutrient uptake outer membrane protein [Parapedobacter tibetensis]
MTRTIVNQLTKGVLLAVFLAFGACNSILELTPESELTEANFFKTAADMDGAVLGIYNNYQTRFPRDWTISEMLSDNTYRTGYFNIGGIDELNNLSITSENPRFADFWRLAYQGVFRANSVIFYINNPTDYAENQQAQLTGEALFMRGLLYFDLVKVFGGVPLVTSKLTVEETYDVPRSSEAEVYHQITEDLKQAIDLLPMKAAIAGGRASKEAAVSLLAKVYVYLKEWDEAKTYLDMVEGFNFQLEAEFKSLWSLSSENNKEVIFAMKYLDGENGQPLSTDFLPYFGVSGISARGNENIFPTWSLYKLYDDEDSRKAETITPYWKSPNSPPADPPVWYPFVNKFAVQHTPNNSGLDLPVLRYADLVLLKAEVLYYLNQPELALAEINRVRQRAFGDDSHNYTLADIGTEEAFLDKLLLERRLEFAFENERWFDLVRTGRYLTELTTVERYYNPSDGSVQTVQLNPQEHHRYMPIPRSQIDLVGSEVLRQNEGYH